MQRSFISRSSAGTFEYLLYDIGVIGYKEALELQLSLHSDVKSGKLGGALILLEHNPVITLGTDTHPENLLVPKNVLASKGIEVIKTDRGGDITYHGPGQLTGYPIINLRAIGSDVHGYLRLIESIIISTLADFGLSGSRNGPAGVWVGEKKVCSIVIAVRGCVTYQGFALNVDPDLSHFTFINPCGLESGRITSIKRLVEPAPDMQKVRECVVKHFMHHLNLEAEAR